MTFTISQLLQLFVTGCAAFATIAGAVAIIIGIIRYFRKPNTERDEGLKKHQEMLENDNRRLKELEESNKIIMQSMLALMSHAIDGNHTDDLKQARDDLQKYLIRR